MSMNYDCRLVFSDKPDQKFSSRLFKENFWRAAEGFIIHIGDALDEFDIEEVEELSERFKMVLSGKKCDESLSKDVVATALIFDSMERGSIKSFSDISVISKIAIEVSMCIVMYLLTKRGDIDINLNGPIKMWDKKQKYKLNRKNK